LAKQNRRIEKGRRDPFVLALPYPFKAWLALSSDPDNTLFKDWQELDGVIWKEIGLPFADSFFIRSFNTHHTHQVDLHGHPGILASHPHDTIHTWGDFVFGGKRGFDRQDAIDHAAIIAQAGFTPRIWTDHSTFFGNLLHVHQYGGQPELRDASGYVYSNTLYTLDLIQAVGVRYVWDGTVTPVMGQGRPMRLLTYHMAYAGSFRTGVTRYVKHLLMNAFGVGIDFRKKFHGNSIYRPHRFADGNTLYLFQRHGSWPSGDIDGLGEVLAPERMEQLMRTGGFCIAYTHLGKRPANRTHDPVHVPASTLAALRNIKDLMERKELMVSSTSSLLDYAVLRDHISVDVREHIIRFNADGIAFKTVGAAELKGLSFTFLRKQLDLETVRVRGTIEELRPRFEDHGDRFSLHFDVP